MNASGQVDTSLSHHRAGRKQRKQQRARRRLPRFESLEPRNLLAACCGSYDPPKINIRLEVTDLAGNPIQQAKMGDEFLLRAHTQDLRPNPQGVFSSYMDVTYDDSIVTALAEGRDGILFGPEYENGQSANLTTPGLIDEIGAFGGLVVIGAGEFELFSAPFSADSAGTFTFAADGPEDIRHENLVYNEDVVIDWELIAVQQAELTIVRPSDVTLSPSLIAENTDTSSGPVEIGTLTASAPINPGSATFSLVPDDGYPDNDKFQIAGNTLSVKQNTVLDHEAQSTYSLLVQAEEGGTTQEAVLTVAVLDRNDGAAGITVDIIDDDTTEAGGEGTFTVTLDAQPSADVLIAVPSQDVTEGTASPMVLTFTPDNWDTPQWVTATGVADNESDDGQLYRVMTAKAISADPDYSGLDADNVIFSNVESPKLRTGVARGVTNDEWTIVDLGIDYASMVVVTSPSYAYDPLQPPLVTRVRNAAGSSFEVMIQRADSNSGTVTADVQYTVVEEGVYEQDPHGVRMEAVRVDSTITDHAPSPWVGSSQEYGQTYTDPVVIGQVMSYNDEGFSVFWARGAEPNEPPSPTVLYVGKHVGKDPDTTRSMEEIGYIVIEAGSGSIDGLDYVADVGPNSAIGPESGAATTYAVDGLVSVTSAVIGAAGMNGSDGYWPALAGPDSVSHDGLTLFADEDLVGRQERKHIAEEVAYLAFGATQPGSPNLQTGSVREVTNAEWTQVNLNDTYNSIVVVATANYDTGDPYDPASIPLVTRVDVLSDTSFCVKVQRADGSEASIDGVTVYYTVLEEGVYTEAQHGVTMEAIKFDSTRTDYNTDAGWVGTTRDYRQPYTEPVVVGQVMSTNDPDFSVFWASGSSRADPPSPGVLTVGKHVGQDPDRDREIEQIGYIVIEAGTGRLAGMDYQAGVGPNTVLGPENGPAVTYSMDNLTSVISAVVSPGGMNGADGYWPVLSGGDAISDSSLKLVAEEDRMADAERKHTSEQVAYLAFGPTSYLAPKLQTGSVPNVTDQWQTVQLDQTYDSMVVVASANYDTGTPDYNPNSIPMVTRIRNATGSSFEVKVQRTDDSTAPITRAVTVYYTVVEEGVYNVADHGAKMEAVKFESTQVDNAPSLWEGELRGYGQNYADPVVVGQVMTTNDEDFSVFWARGPSRQETPTSDVLYVGKHVGQDPDETRASEEIGYIVIEAGSGTFDGMAYAAEVGANTVLGPQNNSVVTYPIGGFSSIDSAAISTGLMNGADGYWPILAGSDAVSAGGLKLVAEEDRMADVERNHIPEQVAYVVFGTPTPPDPKLITGSVSNATTEWQTVDVGDTYESMVVVASVKVARDVDAPPLVARIRNASGSSFEVKVQFADNSTLPLNQEVTVYYTVLEEGVYNMNDHGVTMEAVKFDSSLVDDAPSSWVGTKRSYQQTYADPVVVGQVMSANDTGFSVFWARGSSYSAPPSASTMFVGKHVGQDDDVTRETEVISYIVIEAGVGSIGDVDYVAEVGPNTVLGPWNGPAVLYPLSGLSPVTEAIVSVAGMNGVDGYWPVLSDDDAVTSAGLKLVAEEDRMYDPERTHIAEEVAYIVFGQAAAALRGDVAPNSLPTGGEVASLTQMQTGDLASQALAAWASVLDATPLSSIDISVADLPGDQLGLASGTSIILDVNAAGVGWFIDATPLDNSEFDPVGNACTLIAKPTSAASDRYDLLTVLAHEMGHSLGLEHVDGDHLMSERLRPGERRLPAADLSDELLNDLAEDVAPRWCSV